MNGRAHLRRGILVGLSTFVFATLIVLPAVGMVGHAPLYVAFPVLFLIIAIGVVFDIIGVAVTAAEEVPFHARASKRQPGARQSLWLIRNADRVSNFCNDIVGDVAGTIGGAAAAAIVAQVVELNKVGPTGADLINMVLIGGVAGLTVGGKAWGKGFAISRADLVVREVGLVLYWFRRRAGKKR